MASKPAATARRVAAAKDSPDLKRAIAIRKRLDRIRKALDRRGVTPRTRRDLEKLLAEAEGLPIQSAVEDLLKG